MLEILDDSQVSFYDDSSYTSAIKSLSHSYLSFNPRAHSVKTEGKYHLIELEGESSQLLTALKVASYLTVILPVVAFALEHTLSSAEQVYVYDNPSNQDSAFCAAVSRGDFEEMKVLYTFNPSVVNEESMSGYTPLLEACEGGDLQAIDWLIERNANLHEQNSMGCTPFLNTCARGDLKVAKHLYEVSKGAVFNDRAGNKSTPFIMACYSEDLDLLNWILSIKGNGVLQDRDQFGDTPFLTACSFRELDVAMFLYEIDPNVLSDKNNQQESSFFTALKSASMWGYPDMVDWVLEKGKEQFLSQRDVLGNTAFMSLCLGGDFAASEWLIEKTEGKALDDHNDKGKTAFLIACENGLINIAKWLYEKKGPYILQDKDPDGLTPIDIVRESNFADMKAWFSEICPEKLVAKKTTIEPNYFKHFPKEVLEFCMHHRLFQKASPCKLENGAIQDTVCQKTNQQGAKLDIAVGEFISGQEAVYLSYVPSKRDREEKDLLAMNFIFQNRQLIEVRIHDKDDEVHYGMSDWNTVNEMMKILEKEILPKFATVDKKA